MDDELYGYPAERERLRRRWEAIEAELSTLGDLPAGDEDPAARERRLLEEQDQVEHDLGELEWKERDGGP